LSPLVRREVYQQVPPEVEYSLTAIGKTLVTALVPLGEWGDERSRPSPAGDGTGRVS
jgi:DNA-binding HxlR family transcriptional regulator